MKNSKIHQKMRKQLTNNHIPTRALFEGDQEDFAEHQKLHSETLESKEKYEIKLVWKKILLFTYFHVGALYGLYLMFTSAKLATILFAIFLHQVGLIGVFAGAHRLWSHRSYKATWQLRLLLTIMNTVAFQHAAVDWAQDHRMHHKFNETNADPHNPKRGFFFAHIGWLLCRRHAAVKEKGKQIDMSDLYADPILRFQKKYYYFLMPLMCFILPTIIPVYFWDETWMNAYFVPTILRYTFCLNATWLINSVAHLYGSKPYDMYMNPTENKTISILSSGEGWHNYHHTFPWDYKAAELGKYRYNFTTAFIDFFAKIGWAYDLKTVSSEVIMRRVKRTGDGSHEIWGWGDKDQTVEERNETTVNFHKQKTS